MYDFLYTCIFHMVPRKAILGRAQSAASLYSICLSLILLMTLVAIIAYGKIPVSNRALGAITLIALFGSFILNRMYFLRFSKQRQLHQKYSEWKKWTLKALGIFILIFSFAYFICLSIVVSLRKM